MTISTFDLFKIGIGPSSSHTVGPMKAAGLFLEAIDSCRLMDSIDRVKAEMYGSLGATGKGHGTPKAVLMGLEGETPETIEALSIAQRVEKIIQKEQLLLNQQKLIQFNYTKDLILNKRKSLPLHPNGMEFSAYSKEGTCLLKKTYYSVGGGFVHDEANIQTMSATPSTTGDTIPYPFSSANELLALCKHHQLSISELMMSNECNLHGKQSRCKEDIKQELLNIWHVMEQCVENGCHHSGTLPGGLNVPRRAPELYQKLSKENPKADQNTDPLSITDWVTLYALAVNEENAAGGKIVTAPTNGAAGIIPAVLHYYRHFVPHANDQGVAQFLLTAAAIGTLYKRNASISGAEVGCQGEVGSACSMAAGALCEVMGGTPEQVENAAEIGMEHNLGLTCDPIGGLVQVPCIERNAMAAIKAISACRMALMGNGSHLVSLDKVIETMRRTGEDMKKKYKETARGGLALEVLEVPVNITEC